jgi:hypothetical protein
MLSVALLDCINLTELNPHEPERAIAYRSAEVGYRCLVIARGRLVQVKYLVVTKTVSY